MTASFNPLDLSLAVMASGLWGTRPVRSLAMTQVTPEAPVEVLWNYEDGVRTLPRTLQEAGRMLEGESMAIAVFITLVDGMSAYDFDRVQRLVNSLRLRTAVKPIALAAAVEHTVFASTPEGTPACGVSSNMLLEYAARRSVVDNSPGLIYFPRLVMEMLETPVVMVTAVLPRTSVNWRVDTMFFVPKAADLATAEMRNREGMRTFLNVKDSVSLSLPFRSASAATVLCTGLADRCAVYRKELPYSVAIHPDMPSVWGSLEDFRHALDSDEPDIVPMDRRPSQTCFSLRKIIDEADVWCPMKDAIRAYAEGGGTTWTS